jgi:hypothetical protein
MKKTIAIILAMTLAAQAFTGRAQDTQIFNHLAVGATIGLDGLGIEVASTLTPYVQVRAGYSIFPYAYKTTAGQFGLNNVDFNGTTINLSAAAMKADLNSGGPKLLFDIYPGKKTPFHFTVGLLYHNDMYLKATVNARQPLLDAGFTDGQLNEVYIGLDDNDPDLRISPSADGVIVAGLDTWKLRPYVGIGFGRAVNPKRRVGVTFDMGAFFWGSPTLASYDYSLDPAGRKVTLNAAKIQNNETLGGAASVLGIVEKVPVFLYLKLNIFVRIF